VATPLHNPFWQYSMNKIACEEVLDPAFDRLVDEILAGHERARPAPRA
jgi:hypothetical protein